MYTWTEGLHLVNRVLEAAAILPFACAWIRRWHIPYALRPVYYYVGARFFMFFVDKTSRLVFHNNIYTYHLSTVLMVVLLAQAYYRLFPAGRPRRAIRPAVGVFIAIAIVDAALLNGLFTDLNTYAQAYGYVLLLLLALVHIIYLTRDSLAEPLEKKPPFFLSLAVLLYCSCATVTAVASNIIYHTYHDVATTIYFGILVSAPELFLFTVQMSLLAWMFCFFPLNRSARHALPAWLHYSHRPHSYHVLSRILPLTSKLPRTTTAE